MIELARLAATAAPDRLDATQARALRLATAASLVLLTGIIALTEILRLTSQGLVCSF